VVVAGGQVGEAARGPPERGVVDERGVVRREGVDVGPEDERGVEEVIGVDVGAGFAGEVAAKEEDDAAVEGGGC